MIVLKKTEKSNIQLFRIADTSEPRSDGDYFLINLKLTTKVSKHSNSFKCYFLAIYVGIFSLIRILRAFSSDFHNIISYFITELYVFIYFNVRVFNWTKKVFKGIYNT